MRGEDEQTGQMQHAPEFSAQKPHPSTSFQPSTPAIRRGILNYRGLLRNIDTWVARPYVAEIMNGRFTSRPVWSINLQRAGETNRAVKNPILSLAE